MILQFYSSLEVSKTNLQSSDEMSLIDLVEAEPVQMGAVRKARLGALVRELRKPSLGLLAGC